MVILTNLLSNILGAFTLGTFPVRPFLFIGYLCVIGLAFLVASRIRRAPTGPFTGFSEKLQRIGRAAGISALMLLFALPILSEAYLFHRYAIPQSALATFFTDGEITNTRIAHNHFGKAAISEFLGSRNAALVDESDTGRALVPYMPSIFPMVGLVLLVIAILTSVVVSVAFVRQAPGRAGKVAALILYSLVAFLVLEKSIDGGIASDGAGIAFGALVLFLYSRPESFFRRFTYVIVAYAWLLIGLYAAGMYWSNHYFLGTIARSYELVITVSALVYGIYGKNRRYKMLFTLIACVSLSSFVYVSGKTSRTYLESTLSAESSYITVFDREAALPLPIVGRIGDLTIYDAGSWAGMNVSEISSRYHLPYWYHPISTGSQDCASPVTLHEQSFAVLTPNPLTNTDVSGGLASATFVYKGKTNQDWYLYRATMRENPCIYRDLDSMQEMLRLSGSSAAITYDLNLYSYALHSGPPTGDSKK